MFNERGVKYHTHYDHAPIVEAILEATVQRAAPIQLSELPSVVADDCAYPQRVDLVVASGQLTVGSRDSSPATSQQVGYQFVSADQKMVMHCAQDGLTMSRLQPYTDWEQVFGEFQKYWKRYVEIIKPDKLKRVAVRYVNRFDIPGKRIELSDYFRTYPHVSEDIEADVVGFLNQLQIPQLDIHGHAIITQAGVPPARPGVISILLDIVVSLPLEMNASVDAIDLPMETLHLRKNELFEACMKPAARDLIRETPL